MAIETKKLEIATPKDVVRIEVDLEGASVLLEAVSAKCRVMGNGMAKESGLLSVKEYLQSVVESLRGKKVEAVETAESGGKTITYGDTGTGW